VGPTSKLGECVIKWEVKSTKICNYNKLQPIVEKMSQREFIESVASLSPFIINKNKKIIILMVKRELRRNEGSNTSY